MLIIIVAIQNQIKKLELINILICLVKNLSIRMDENMVFMNLKQIIIDSLRYSASDLKMVVFLGLVILIADMANELSGVGKMADELRLVLFSVVILLAIFEAGYAFRILEETIKGSKKLPQFNKLGLMFSHGLKELIILTIYFSIPLLLFVLYFFNFLISTDLNKVPGENVTIFLGILSLTVIIFAFFPAVLLHRAHHNGDLRSGFEFRKIYNKIKSVGLKRLILVYLGIFLVVSILEVAFADSIAGTIPVFDELIPDLIIAPYLLIFTTRVLGLIDQP
jgi:Protein of unknown function (DUF4013)